LAAVRAVFLALGVLEVLVGLRFGPVALARAGRWRVLVLALAR